MSQFDPHYVFSRGKLPSSAPRGVHFVMQPIRTFAKEMREQKGKNLWMMGGGELIAAFLDEGAIDELFITVIPTFIGEGIPLIAPRHLEVPLGLKSVKKFPDGVAQLHYEVLTATPLAAR